MSDGIFIEGINRLLLQFAERSARRADDVADVPWEHGGHSVTAIILAAAAVEAHVGEWIAKHAEAAGISATISGDWAPKQLPV